MQVLHPLSPYLPEAHDALRGVDTEAAEQIFHIAARWQASLATAHPVHQELQLLIYSHERNERQCPDVPWERYQIAQASGASLDPGAHVDACAASASTACTPPARPAQKRAKPRQTCQVPPPDRAPVDVGQADPPIHLPPRRVSRDFLAGALVLVNPDTNTVHRVDAAVQDSVRTGCHWIPAPGARRLAVPAAQLSGSNLYSCGTCFGRRHALDL